MELKNKQNLECGKGGGVVVEDYLSARIRNAQKGWSFIGLFIICLVISMPFYSANVMATTLSINTNTGTAGIDGFLNAESDTWAMQATVTNYGGTAASEDTTFGPDQIFLEVGSSKINFNSCSGDSFSTTCDFQSVLDDGISEGSFQFDVRLYDLLQDPDDENSTNLGSELASDSKTIFADGSEPSITWNHLYQDGEVIYLDFDVSDNPSGSCVGLRLIEIIDSDSGVVLSSMELEEVGDCFFNYANDGYMSGVLDSEISGEGKRQLKIRATDFLGHTKSSSAKSFDTDFVSPSIVSGSLELIDFGDYIGQYSQATDVSVKVKECSGLEEVTAYSEQMQFYSVLGDCDVIDIEDREASDDDCTYVCTWDDITVSPEGSSSVEATIVALDESGNEASSDVVASFSVDSTGPVVEYIGTEYQYDSKNFVPAIGNSKIIAKIIDSGVGITEDKVALNLKSMGGTDWSQPNECILSSSGINNCYWDVSGPGDPDSTYVKEISLVYLEDSVGNSGETMSSEVVVDGKPPIVHGIEFYGFSAVGKKDFFQSNDDLVIELLVSEGSGVVVYVEASDIVMDSATKFSYGENVEQEDGSSEYEASEWDGWAKFTEDDCERVEDTNVSSLWSCEFKINSIKSGYDPGADFEVVVTDTSGNPSDWSYSDYVPAINAEDNSDGDFEIEIFALDEETKPDFWEVGNVAPMSSIFGRVDLDQVEISRAKIMELISFDSTLDGVLASKIDVDSCQSENSNAPLIHRVLQYKTITGLEENPEVSVLFEFEQFDPKSLVDLSSQSQDFDELIVEYECIFKIYSVYDETAMNFAEEQIVTVGIPFGYTGNGAANANVEAYVYELTHTKTFQFLDSIKYVTKVLEWIRYLSPIVSMLSSIATIFATVQHFTEPWQRAEVTKGIGIATCVAPQAGYVVVSDIVNGLSNVLQIFTCNPSPSPTTAYARYQNGVLEMYKNWRAAGPLSEIGGAAGGVFSGLSAKGSLYDNIWISIIGLCIPGVLYNLEKFRQIYCVEAKCLLEEVPAGMATITTCKEGFKFMSCKYFWDGIMDFVPIIGLLESISEIFKSLASNPLGWISLASSIFCTLGPAGCPTTGVGAGTCNTIEILFKVIDIVGNIYGMTQSYAGLNADICKELEVDRDYGEEDQEAATSVTTDVIAASDSSDSTTSDSVEASEE